MALLVAVGRHLVDGTIGTAGHQLLALVAPGDTANLGSQHLPIGTADESPLLQVCHQQGAVPGNHGTQLGGLRCWVGNERPQRLAVGGQFEGCLRRAL